MTAEEARRFQDEWIASRQKWGEQDLNGDDVSLIHANLRLTVSERFERYENAARLALEVSYAGKRAGLQSSL